MRRTVYCDESKCPGTCTFNYRDHPSVQVTPLLISVSLAFDSSAGRNNLYYLSVHEIFIRKRQGLDLIADGDFKSFAKQLTLVEGQLVVLD